MARHPPIPLQSPHYTSSRSEPLRCRVLLSWDLRLDPLDQNDDGKQNNNVKSDEHPVEILDFPLRKRQYDIKPLAHIHKPVRQNLIMEARLTATELTATVSRSIIGIRLFRIFFRYALETTMLQTFVLRSDTYLAMPCETEGTTLANSLLVCTPQRQQTSTSAMPRTTRPCSRSNYQQSPPFPRDTTSRFECNRRSRCTVGVPHRSDRRAQPTTNRDTRLRISENLATVAVPAPAATATLPHDGPCTVFIHDAVAESPAETSDMLSCHVVQVCERETSMLGALTSSHPLPYRPSISSSSNQVGTSAQKPHMLTTSCNSQTASVLPTAPPRSMERCTEGSWGRSICAPWKYVRL